jgi:regulator of replication initiation timing
MVGRLMMENDLLKMENDLLKKALQRADAV